MNHPLDGFRGHDSHHGGDRAVSFFRAERENYAHASEERYFRLTEVKQQWVEVDES